jgi:hypothetical protein
MSLCVQILCDLILDLQSFLFDTATIAALKRISTMVLGGTATKHSTGREHTRILAILAAFLFHWR